MELIRGALRRAPWQAGRIDIAASKDEHHLVLRREAPILAAQPGEARRPRAFGHSLQRVRMMDGVGDRLPRTSTTSPTSR